MIVKYKLRGKEVNPVNKSEIVLEINHDQESVINQVKPHVGVTNLYFAREDILEVMSDLDNPPGITEGVPFDIEITEKGSTEVVNMYLNLMEQLKRSRDGIQASVKMLQSLDWLEDRIDGFTFETMYNETGVAPFKVDNITYNSFQEFFDKRCIYIPYVISTIPEYQNAFMALITLVFVCIQIYRGIKDIVQAAEVWVQLIIEIPFLVALIFTMLALIERLINFLLQPLKYHGAMLMIDLLKITCVKLGLTFHSSRWEFYPLNTLAYMPEKYNPPTSNAPTWAIMTGFSFGPFGSENAKDAQLKGYTSPAYAPATVHDSNTPNIQHGYFNGTGGDFLRFAKSFCNGKIIIPDQTNDLLLERRDFYPANSNVQLPDIRQDWNGWNTDEFSQNILIEFFADLNDKNCIDNFVGTILQAQHEQVIINDPRLTLGKGSRTVKINASRGIRKENFTYVEDIVSDVVKIMNNWSPLLIIFMNSNIFIANSLIAAYNGLIAGINGLIFITITIINTINAIIWFVNLTGAGISYIPVPSNPFFAYTPLIQPITQSNFPTLPNLNNRIGALLLENDMVDTPKLLMVDTTTGTFASNRIAYLDVKNKDVVNSKYVWDNFYFIDAFVGAQNNRFTKIAPALNKESEINPFLLSVAKFKSMVSNPKLNDNFAEEIISDSIKWRIGDESGRAEIMFRKQGWLRDPQNTNGAKRAQEININLSLKISLPNGQ